MGAIALAADTKPAASTKAAATQATSAPGAKVEAAIKAFSSDSWKERQAAQDTLVTLGEEIVPRLRKLASQSGDEEVRTRAGRRFGRLRRTISSAHRALHCMSKTPSRRRFLQPLANRGRCEFPTWPRNLFQQNINNTLVTLDYDHADFWTVFKDACQKSGVFPQQIGNERGMTLQQGSSSYWNGPSVITGPFLIVANRIYRSNSIDLANPGNVQHDFQLSLWRFFRAEDQSRAIVL